VWVHSFINLFLVWENIMMRSCLLARTCHRKVWIPLECVSLCEKTLWCSCLEKHVPSMRNHYDDVLVCLQYLHNRKVCGCC
jgi:hypothetical protein